MRKTPADRSERKNDGHFSRARPPSRARTKSSRVCGMRKRQVREGVVTIPRVVKSLVQVALPQPRLVYAAELKRFLSSADQKVLLLHGSWGTGKTYFWNDFVRKERQCIQETFYSYASLFGA